MRKFSSKYNDVFKQYLLGILERIPYIHFLQQVDDDAFRELVYYMKVTKHKVDEYLFRPGEKVTDIMLITEGEFELSGSFESEDLAKHRYAAGEVMPEVEMSEYQEKYQAGKLDALKRRIEVVPVEKNKAINGYIMGYGAR